VNFPGHFLVRHEPEKGEPVLIDVFEEGQVVTPADAAVRVRRATDRPLEDTDLKSVTSRQVLARMLQNLLGLAQRGQDAAAVIRYLDALLTLEPERGYERFLRGVLLFQTGRRTDAIADVEWLLEKRPDDVDLDKVQEFRQLLDRP
jgi:serine protease Do